MNQNKAKYADDEEFPDLSNHNNHMAHVLTKEIFSNLRNRVTPNGFTLDGAIQTGVDNPGKATIVQFCSALLASMFACVLIYFSFYDNKANISENLCTIQSSH